MNKYTAYQLTNIFIYYKLDPISDKESSQMFIKNAWYVACRPEEIQDKPLGRTICGEKIVFIVVKKTKLQPLKIFVRIVVPHSHLAMSKMATLSVATMA